MTRDRIALMVFLIAYALFEVPSNYFLKKLRPSVCQHISIILPVVNMLIPKPAMDRVPHVLMGRSDYGSGRSAQLRPGDGDPVPLGRNGGRSFSRSRVLSHLLVSGV